MNRRVRVSLFIVAWLILLPSAGVLAVHMPTFGAHPLPYGDLINSVAASERHVSNMVSAVNFDYRGFDTLAEEFMLVCAVTGVVGCINSCSANCPHWPATARCQWPSCSRS